MVFAKPPAKPPANFNPKLFSKRLGDARSREKLTQSELAKKSGLTAAAISHFECGQRIPSVPNLYKLCRALNTQSDYLLGLI